MKKNQKVSVKHLQIGMFIRLPLSWKDHPFLFSSFKIKNLAQIEIIRNLTIEHVFIDADKSDVKPDENETPDTNIDAAALATLKQDMDAQKIKQIESQQKLHRNLKKTQKQFDRSLSMMRSMTAKIAGRPINAVNEAKDLVNNLTDMLLASDDLALHLMSDPKPGDTLYQHAVNVSMLCMLMAKELGWSREAIELIGLSALFHDIGKLKVPSNVLNKQPPLTPPEQNLINQHPLMSLNFLSLAESFPEDAKSAIANHHEFLDGSGYPKGLTAEQLNEPSQLIAVVNEYDHLCNSNKSNKAKTPSVALGLLYKNYQKKLNADFVGKLIKKLGVYPPGSVVELSSGQFALVMSVNLNKILFPNVIVYDPLVPKDHAPIISLETEDITIVRSLPPSGLPEKVYKYLNPREQISYAFGNN